MNKNLFTYALFVLVILGTFLYFTYFILIDVYVIEDHLFLKYFHNKMVVLSVTGYFVAGICFTSYLLLAQKAEILNKEGPEKCKIQLQSLKSTFDYSFNFSALILSVFIIWLGVMFHSINSMELMTYYSQISGKQYLNNDFVYLVGLLHSLLLLIFYIPVQMKFQSLKIVQDEQKESTKSMPGYKNIISALVKSLSPILLTASPLITSLMQNWITGLLGDG